MNKRIASLTFLLQAMVACSDGSNVIGDRPMVMPAEDTGPSVSNDGGNPTADASPDSQTPMDAAVTPDVPPPPVDADMMATCHDVVIANQTISLSNGFRTTEPVRMSYTVTSSEITISLEPFNGLRGNARCTGQMSTCVGMTTWEVIVDGVSTPVPARFESSRIMSGTMCSRDATITVTNMMTSEVVLRGTSHAI